jgi:hypothetical protein
MTERRYDEDEVAEILERATSSEEPETPRSGSPGTGLTLKELQEIGGEVGIPASSIADAARALDVREPAGASRRVLGVPLAVSRIVPIDRALTDDEWDRLVVDLRMTFEAEGRVWTHGALRSWSNGNLQILVEPEWERYRVRMRTLKGNAAPLAIAGTAFLFISAVILASNGTAWRELLPAALVGMIGLVQFGYLGVSLPRWARERAEQMEGLAERIPLLLKE